MTKPKNPGVQGLDTEIQEPKYIHKTEGKISQPSQPHHSCNESAAQLQEQGILSDSAQVRVFDFSVLLSMEKSQESLTARSLHSA